MTTTHPLLPGVRSAGALTAALAGAALLAPVTGFAADEDLPPGVQALEEFREGTPKRDPVENRYFLKGKRFELTPNFGLVPNNAFARRFTVGLNFGYHFNENLSVQGRFSFAPDLGKSDVKGLVPILLQRAPDPAFQQPLDKVTLAASFGVAWAPVYGKINILGETVVNFDFYGFLGLGLVVQNEYVATENPNPADTSLKSFFDLSSPPVSEVRVAPTIGLGGNFFITQGIALRLDGSFAIFPDDKPQYDPNNPVEGLRVVSMFTASAGIAIFFPKMKPRVDDF